MAPDERAGSNEPQVDVDTHVVFRERECQGEPLEDNISEGSFSAIAGRPEQSGLEFLHLEAQLEGVLMNLGALFDSWISSRKKN